MTVHRLKKLKTKKERVLTAEKIKKRNEKKKNLKKNLKKMKKKKEIIRGEKSKKHLKSK